ncbi:hypothetical protein DVH24_039394 [Malus domestica]|uniref:Uncharacterized protein n=1 Tax=Malus domestica TaxID=3750 RepID=A0A498I189_MALDO|nr:hypothetical protein DVH24_039394 [Malus domestica]
MALFRKFFYRKPPDGLLEISESVYESQLRAACLQFEDVYIWGCIFTVSFGIPKNEVNCISWTEKQYTEEHKTLDMIYKQAPRELLQLMPPLNPMPSQQRL